MEIIQENNQVKLQNLGFPELFQFISLDLSTAFDLGVLLLDGDGEEGEVDVEQGGREVAAVPLQQQLGEETDPVVLRLDVVSLWFFNIYAAQH